MTRHFADRLTDAIRDKGVAACVGLDPLIERLPHDVLYKHGLDSSGRSQTETQDPSAIGGALLEFGQGVIKAVAPLVPVIKINIAFFERYHAEGVRVYYRLVKAARDAGLIAIGDVKRADIGHSTTQYAHAQLADIMSDDAGEAATPDAVTVNPYLGFDAIKPFLSIAEQQGKGLFVLVQTSNATAAAVQGLAFGDGLTVCQKVGQLTQQWAATEATVGESGYSSIGAVVSPRDVPSTVKLRELMPNCIFLVPGFGAQGRTAEEVARCFKPDGTGAFVTSSRGVIYAHEIEEIRAAVDGNWQKCVELGCKDLVEAIRGVTPG
jgi:orotidine-5'-phosphate decarboxylase